MQRRVKHAILYASKLVEKIRACIFLDIRILSQVYPDWFDRSHGETPRQMVYFRQI